MDHDTDLKSRIDNSKFNTDWSEFLDLLVAMIRENLGDRDIGAYFAEQEITWVARVKKLNLTRKSSQGIDLDMGTPQVKIDEKRELRAKHVVLNFRDDVADSWKGCAEGNLVKFRAKFRGNGGVMPAVGVSRYTDGVSFALKLGLKQGDLLEVIQEKKLGS